MSSYFLPKNIVKKNSDIIIYGCGKVGRSLIQRVIDEKYCNIAAVIDEKQKGERYEGIPIIDLAELQNYSYDYIVIGSIDYAEEMMKVLLDEQIDKDKIITISRENRILYSRDNIPYMEIDKIQNTYTENLGEYVRYRCLELVAKEIYKANVPGDIAEAGVYMGNFAKALSLLFRDKDIYLYDTFEGFTEKDIEVDIDKRYTSVERFGNKQGISIFKREDMSSEEQIECIKRKLYKTDNVYFRKGNFPDTAVGEEENVFALVSLDMDLYRPTKDGLEFFWKRLSKGGYIFLHDYNGIEHLGVEKALEELEMQYGKIAKVPIPDQYGSIVLIK